MDFEVLILNFVENIANTNFSLVINILQLVFVIFWIFVLGWVWVDAGERTTKTSSKVVSVVLVGVLNIVGLLIYLIIRPKQTLQDLYWIDLERRFLKYETAELGDCPNCKSSLQPGYNMCPKCGFSIKQQCTGCQVWIDRNYNYCPFCGMTVTVNTSKDSTLSEIVATKDAIIAAKDRAIEAKESVILSKEEIIKTKEAAIQSVENDKTKYVERGGVVGSVKKDFFTFAKKVGDFFLAKKSTDQKVSKKVVKENKKPKSRKKKNK